MPGSLYLRQQVARAARWFVRRIDGTLAPTSGASGYAERLERLELAVADLRAGRSATAPHSVETCIGVPGIVDRPNAQFMRPYLADRCGLVVRYLGNLFSPQHPDALWLDDGSREFEGPVFLRSRVDLAVGDRLRVLEDQIFDIGVDCALIRVEHEQSGQRGFLTLETLVGETAAEDDALWAAADNAALRALVEFRCDGWPLYSTNYVSPREVRESLEYLGKFRGASAEAQPGGDGVHPLQAGAHAHRIACWALEDGRVASERDRVRGLIDAMFEVYAFRHADELRPGVWAWPYNFDFTMPWGTILKAPWYSGYANSAMAGAAACAYRLTGDERYADAVRRAIAFLRLPMAEGGAGYFIDGYPYIAEYAYRSPPIPNYRVLDGELCSVIYLYNAARILGDSELLRWCVQLAAGLAGALKLFCAQPGGLPYFGMDAQQMNPDYMWQLWMTLQLLANAFKDRRFLEHARRWRAGIPEELIRDGAPV